MTHFSGDTESNLGSGRSGDTIEIMTVSTHGSAGSGMTRQSPLSESRELGLVMPDTTPIVTKESPFSKSWPHLVAGG